MFYVANVTKLSVFSLLNYIFQIANLFSFHEMYTFLLGSNVVVDNLSQTMLEYWFQKKTRVPSSIYEKESLKGS